MAWRDNLLQASFRGIEFLTETDNLQSGRMLQVHDYPFRETPFIEDMGGSANRYNINAYLIGQEYDTARNSLLQALKEPGAGQLTHHRYGNITAFAESFTVTHANKQGGIARFSIVFVQVGTEVVATKDLVLETQARAETAQEAINTNFSEESGYNVPAENASVVESAVFDLNAVTNTLERMTKDILAPAGTLADITRQVNEFRFAIQALIRTPAALASDLAALMAAITGVARIEATNPVQQVKATFVAFFRNESFGNNFLPLGDTQSLANQRAMIELYQFSSVVSLSDLLTGYTYASQDEGATRLQEYNQFIFEVNTTENNNLFQAIQDLQASTAAMVNQQTQDLQKEKQARVTDPTPSLSLAKQLNTEELQLIELNNVRDPLFTKGNIGYIPLES